MITVGEVARKELWTLTSDTGVPSALRLAAQVGTRHLLVFDHGVMTGVVSRTALVHAASRREVREVMATPVLCVAPETTVAEAIQIMEEQRVGFLPVVANGLLLGYVDEAVLGIPVRQAGAFSLPDSN